MVGGIEQLISCRRDELSRGQTVIHTCNLGSEVCGICETLALSNDFPGAEEIGLAMRSPFFVI